MQSKCDPAKCRLPGGSVFAARTVDAQHGGWFDNAFELTSREIVAFARNT
jgi:hypothetical protein